MAQYEVTLRGYWRILRRRKGIVVFTAFLLGFFSFLLASIWKPQPLYQATAKVQINLNHNLTGRYLQTIAYNSGDQIETQQTIITSQPVLRRTAAELGLLTRNTTAPDSALILQDLKRIITTSQEGFTNIITVSAKHPVPERARDMANTLSRVYRDYDHELKNQQPVRHREFVEMQRSNARSMLEKAEEAVRLYRERSELISLESQASVNLQGIRSSEREEQRLVQDLAAIDVMVAEMESSGGLSERTLQGTSVQRVGETFMSLSRNLNDQRLQRDALLVQLTPDHPNVRRVQVKIDQLTGDLTGELRQRREAMRRDLDAERVRLANLREQYNLLPSMGLELSRLQREVAMRQEVVTVLEESYQEALILEADKVEEVSVLEWALTPSIPTNPHHPMRRAIMGVLLGLVLGVVFAVVAETLDTPERTLEQKVRDWSRRWGKRLGIGEDDHVPPPYINPDAAADVDSDDLEDEDDYDEEDGGSGLGRRLVTYVALAVAAVGVSWQSGVLPGLLSMEPTAEVLSAQPRMTSQPPQTLADPVERVDPQRMPTPEPQGLVPVEPQVTDAAPSDVERLAADARMDSQEPQSEVGEPQFEADVPLFEIIETPRSYVVRVAAYLPGSLWVERNLTALRQAGEDAFLSPVHVDSERYLRLLVGRFQDWDGAFSYAEQLRDAGAIDEFTVLHLPYAVRGEGVINSPYTTLNTKQEPILAGAFATAGEAGRFVADPRVWPRGP
ncbi:MAG: GNVR domain-containing protein [Candidatus Latescibacterota bacterium]|nr:GNVR domain-containing protein [Candidatus Latescibacterota bacterium]